MRMYIAYSIAILLLIVCMILTNILPKNRDFGEVFLITLEKRKDRLQQFLNGYNASDMNAYDLTKFNALDGSKIKLHTVPLTDLAQLELKQLETIGFRYKHYQLTKGAIGCYLSHVRIWERIMQSNKEHALIFEDDASIPINCALRMKRFLHLIPDDWDVVLFGKHCSDCEDLGKYLKVNRFILLHSYMISRRGISKILDEGNLFPISQQLDAYLSEITYKLNIYAPKTNIVNQIKSRTDIQAPIVRNSKMNDRLIMLEN